MEENKKSVWASIGKAVFEIGKEVTPVIAVNTIYSKVFSKHIDTEIGLSFFIEDFPNLRRTRYTFKSNKRQTLVGYMYYYENVKPTTIVVLAHGFGGGGQRTYMDVTNALCKRGLYVFAYDATGNDESEGILKGFPQQVIDLDYAIRFVKKLKEYKKLPICLFGHSMGGYAVSAVLNYHPEVKAVVACSGFNCSSEIVKQQASKFTCTSLETLELIKQRERRLFGKYAKKTAIDGFKNTTAEIMIIHSLDDPVIPIEAGFEKYHKVFYRNKRFTFIKLKNAGHGTVYYSDDGVKYAKDYNERYKKFCKSKGISEQDKANFAINNLNRQIWSSLIDETLFDKISKFYIEK